MSKIKEEMGHLLFFEICSTSGWQDLSKTFKQENLKIEGKPFNNKQ